MALVSVFRFPAWLLRPAAGNKVFVYRGLDGYLRSTSLGVCRRRRSRSDNRSKGLWLLRHRRRKRRDLLYRVLGEVELYDPVRMSYAVDLGGDSEFATGAFVYTLTLRSLARVELDRCCIATNSGRRITSPSPACRPQGRHEVEA
ncbi:hypothetical protein BGZ60DRAFT_37754 [Tricladium varicosporioides]|nr:hypothetical protein BGZ60DRAFT_37754 [Hymenoscyphus varicosporioides]